MRSRNPGDVDVRLALAELELAAGDVQAAIAEAGIAIQLAPTDLRGMSVLLAAQDIADHRVGTDARPVGDVDPQAEAVRRGVGAV